MQYPLMHQSKEMLMRQYVQILKHIICMEFIKEKMKFQTSQQESVAAWSNAVYNGDVDVIKRIYDEHPRSLNSRINSEGETALLHLG